MKSFIISTFILAESIFLATLPMETVTAQTSPIKINAQTKLGAVKPVNGVCNSPISFSGLIDCSYYFKEANFPYSRLCGGFWMLPPTIDIPMIFRNSAALITMTDLPIDIANFYEAQARMEN